MNSYKVLVVEDDPRISESLSEMLEILNHEVVGVAESYDEVVKIMEKNDADVALLDIQIKGDKTGIDVAELLKNDYHIPFLFTTAFADADTIKRATKHSPYGYLVKPYGMKDINAGIELAVNNHKNVSSLKNEEGNLFNTDNLFVKVNSRLVRIEPKDILFVEAKGDYVLFKTKEKGYIVHSTIKNIESKLDPSIFVKVHRSYIVNVSKIVDIEENNLLIGDLVIPISRGQKGTLLGRLNTI
ncbi:response regulator transcription factor [Fulvivirga sp. M361]|uniref:LytR/AlgR family response regulator transcription factor n=1 Tax=Fulvivirga sp. M361 TaxID=2594266 RepID=UPI00117B3B28|nr:response regulator [Fulvivirga sp. M361]TRX59475.1 response regulator transcription factor [Fulvivirga sp. M361]